MASIELKTIENLKKQNFYIPDYQRGYRWGKEQVTDLIDDLKEFFSDRYLQNKSGQEIYCIQPLVVKEDTKNSRWDVIDGQQRLTTIFIILSCLSNDQPYSIEYQTREKSNDFLKNLANDITEDYKKNADFYHMHFAYETVKSWKESNTIDNNDFSKMIKERVNFIWYELGENEDPIKVFTRLNIGKISLTESELIKALFLNRNNFNSSTKEKEKLLTLVEIAGEWDKIEYRLQDDRFWLFFHETDYARPTRIDFILELIRKMDSNANNNNDKMYPTFAYYYDIIKKATDKQTTISELWKKIYGIFATIEEWYNDEVLYHYIGYLSCFKGKKTTELLIKEYLEKYQNNNKPSFVDDLKSKIKDLCKNIRNLDFVYEEPEEGKKSGTSKTQTRPLLLLHNVQTIINQNASIADEKKYDMPDFIRFPFHLFKKESWDVEHIRPNNLQDFQGDKKKNEILKYVYVLRQSTDPDIVEALRQYDISIGNGDSNAFDTLWKAINNSDKHEELADAEKNKIWNYVLLDASTNREYGNACFSIKRDYVLKKEKGIKPKLEVDKSKNVILSESSEAAFVPICTGKVFSKEFTQFPDNLMYWTKKDAAYYRMDIEETLWWYLSDKKITEQIFKENFKEYREEIIQNELYDEAFAKYMEEKNANIGGEQSNA